MLFLLSFIYIRPVYLFVSRWSGSHIRWGQPFRLRHVTTGKYLSLTEEKSLLLVDKVKADIKSTVFCFRSSKVQGKKNVRQYPHPRRKRLCSILILIQLIHLCYVSLKYFNIAVLYKYFLSPLGKIGPWCKKGG